MGWGGVGKAATTRTGPNDARRVVWAIAKLIFSFLSYILSTNCHVTPETHERPHIKTTNNHYPNNDNDSQQCHVTTTPLPPHHHTTTPPPNDIEWGPI